MIAHATSSASRDGSRRRERSARHARCRDVRSIVPPTRCLTRDAEDLADEPLRDAPTRTGYPSATSRESQTIAIDVALS
jgi:hypothetical protein